MNGDDRPAIPQDGPGDERLEPELPRREMVETAVAVVVTLGLAAVVLAVALVSSGVLATVLILAAPTLVLVGAIVVGVATYRCYRDGGRWQIWQGGLWFLLMVFLLWVFGALGVVLAD